jgi:hypothetical protein
MKEEGETVLLQSIGTDVLDLNLWNKKLGSVGSVVYLVPPCLDMRNEYHGIYLNLESETILHGTYVVVLSLNVWKLIIELFSWYLWCLCLDMKEEYHFSIPKSLSLKIDTLVLGLCLLG